MNTKWESEKEKLIDLINNQEKTFEEIGKLYNCSGSNIRKVAQRLGITWEARIIKNPNQNYHKGEFKNSTFICQNCGKEHPKWSGYSNKFCSNKCAIEFNHKELYKEFCEGSEKMQKGNYSPKPFYNDILKEQDNKCAICGQIPEWNGKPLKLIIDHIDGHASHNYRSNLRCICPNCDSQLDTYKLKNKNGDRSYYRYHKNKTEQHDGSCN